MVREKLGLIVIFCNRELPSKVRLFRHVRKTYILRIEFDDTTDEVTSLLERLDLDDNSYDISCLSEDEDLLSLCLSDYLSEEEIDLIRDATDVGFA